MRDNFDEVGVQLFTLGGTGQKSSFQDIQLHAWKSFTETVLTQAFSLCRTLLSGVTSKVLPKQGASPPNRPNRHLRLLWDPWVAHGEAS